MKPKKLSRLSALWAKGYHSSIMTTYSVDLAFYEHAIHSSLRRGRVKTELLLADATMLGQALSARPGEVRRVGQAYAIQPISIRGAFHPKVHLRLGKASAWLDVGSGNVTAAGWLRNLEVHASFEASMDGAGSRLMPLMRKAFDYLGDFAASAPGSVAKRLLDDAADRAPWMHTVTTNSAPIELDDGTAIDVWCDRGGDRPSLMERLQTQVSQDAAARSLWILSPYWDSSLQGLRALHAAVGAASTQIILPDRHGFPVNALSADDAHFSFLRLPMTPAARFAHAKVFIVQTDRWDHLVFGSANCSDDALGLAPGPSRNAEVSLYRRLPKGEGMKALALDGLLPVAAGALPQPVAAHAPASGATPTYFGGCVERQGRLLRWHPPQLSSASGAEIEAFDETLSLTQGPEGWVCEPAALGRDRAQNSSRAHLARVRIKDRGWSAPMLIHDVEAIRNAAQAKSIAALQRLLQITSVGDSGELWRVVDLMTLATELFADPALASRGGARTRVGATTAPASAPPMKVYLSETSAVLDLVSAMLGHASTGTEPEPTAAPADKHAPSASGDNDHEYDDEGDAEDEQDAARDLPPALVDEANDVGDEPKRAVRERTTSRRSFFRLRARLEKKLRIQPCVADDVLVDRAMSEGLMMLQLLAIATFQPLCVDPCEIKKGPKTFEAKGVPAPQTLAVLTRKTHVEARPVFDHIAIRLLTDCWLGSAGQPSPISRIKARPLPGTRTLHALILMSKWTVAALHLHAKPVGKLAKHLREVEDAIFAQAPALCEERPEESRRFYEAQDRLVAADPNCVLPPERRCRFGSWNCPGRSPSQPSGPSSATWIAARERTNSAS